MTVARGILERQRAARDSAAKSPPEQGGRSSQNRQRDSKVA